MVSRVDEGVHNCSKWVLLFNYTCMCIKIRARKLNMDYINKQECSKLLQAVYKWMLLYLYYIKNKKVIKHQIHQKEDSLQSYQALLFLD